MCDLFYVIYYTYTLYDMCIYIMMWQYDYMFIYQQSISKHHFFSNPYCLHSLVICHSSYMYQHLIYKYQHLVYIYFRVFVRAVQFLDIITGMFCHQSLVSSSLFKFSQLSVPLKEVKNFIFFILHHPCPKCLLQKMASNQNVLHSPLE